MKYVKVHLKAGMRPWMLEREFQRELSPGIFKDWDTLVREGKWIVFYSPANTTAFTVLNRVNGRMNAAEDITYAASKWIGKEDPNPPKYTEKQNQMMQDYRRVCIALPRLTRELKRAHQERHMLVAELERQLGGDFDTIVRKEVGNWGQL